MIGAEFLGKDGSYVLQLELRFGVLLNSYLCGVLRRIVIVGKLLVELVGCGINRSSSGAELFDGLCHFCHL